MRFIPTSLSFPTRQEYFLAGEKTFGDVVSIRGLLRTLFTSSSYEYSKAKNESSLEELFRKRKNQVVVQALFIWRLNLRISGCILESKKYGWLFYYSQMSDLKILFQLDWLIKRFFNVLKYFDNFIAFSQVRSRMAERQAGRRDDDSFRATTASCKPCHGWQGATIPCVHHDTSTTASH